MSNLHFQNDESHNRDFSFSLRVCLLPLVPESNIEISITEKKWHRSLKYVDVSTDEQMCESKMIRSCLSLFSLAVYTLIHGVLQPYEQSLSRRFLGHSDRFSTKYTYELNNHNMPYFILDRLNFRGKINVLTTSELLLTLLSVLLSSCMLLVFNIFITK